MGNKGTVSVFSILIIILISIVGIFSIPAFRNLKENVLSSNYDSNADDIIESAKSKYGANISNITKDGVLEYTVEELIKDGYLKEEDIDVDIDRDSKVLVIIKNGYVTYKYVNGATLINKISPDMKKINNEYYFISDNPNNYISFNDDIYRIVKIDKDNNIVIVKDEYEKQISKNDIDDYLNIVVNDDYGSKYKNMIIGKLELLDVNTYINTKENDLTYLNKSYSFWLSDNNEYKVFDSFSNVFIESDKAYVPFLIKLDCSILSESGNGSRINPYIISE